MRRRRKRVVDGIGVMKRGLPVRLCPARFSAAWRTLRNLIRIGEHSAGPICLSLDLLLPTNPPICATDWQSLRLGWSSQGSSKSRQA
jgi:hypothetical protein